MREAEAARGFRFWRIAGLSWSRRSDLHSGWRGRPLPFVLASLQRKHCHIARCPRRVAREYVWASREATRRSEYGVHEGAWKLVVGAAGVVAAVAVTLALATGGALTRSTAGLPTRAHASLQADVSSLCRQFATQGAAHTATVEMNPTTGVVTGGQVVYMNPTTGVVSGAQVIDMNPTTGAVSAPTCG